MTDTFKPGDRVRFKGLRVGKIVLEPRSGVLKLSDRNTTIKGVVSIVDDRDRLLFTPDGELYCHGQHGVLLEKEPKA